MVDATLKNYVKTTLKQGYAVSGIRKRLAQSGYTQKEINEVCRAVKRRKIISAKTGLIAAIAIVVLIIVIVLSLKLLAPAPKDFYISTTPLVSSVIPGGKLTFVNSLTSATPKTVTIELKHQMFYKKTGKQAAVKKEKVTLSKKSSTQTQTVLPSAIPLGEYEMITTASYRGTSKQSTFNFVVEESKGLKTPSFEEPKPVDTTSLCPTGCDDYNSCTSDQCVNGICENTAIIPCCGNGKCESGEDAYACSLDCGSKTETKTGVIDKAIKTARTNPSTATMLCNSLPSVYDADSCFNTLSEKTSKYEFCESIQEDEMQSSCLMDFALEGNYDVCDKINDPYYLQSCFSLERQAKLQGLVSSYS